MISSKTVQLIVLVCILCGIGSVAAAELKCARNADVVDRCFNMHGRVYLTATSQIVIWPVGSKRLLNVPFDYNQGKVVPLPENLQALIEQDMIVFGDLVICPLTRQQPTGRQYACIESASNLVPLSQDEWKKLQGISGH
jgi:hypothetical protein